VGEKEREWKADPECGEDGGFVGCAREEVGFARFVGWMGWMGWMG